MPVDVVSPRTGGPARTPSRVTTPARRPPTTKLSVVDAMSRTRVPVAASGISTKLVRGIGIARFSHSVRSTRGHARVEIRALCSGSSSIPAARKIPAWAAGRRCARPSPGFALGDHAADGVAVHSGRSRRTPRPPSTARDPTNYATATARRRSTDSYAGRHVRASKEVSTAARSQACQCDRPPARWGKMDLRRSLGVRAGASGRKGRSLRQI